MVIIGITGGLATGKTTAAKYLKGYLKGYLIDADRLAHAALRKDSLTYERIVSCFGKGILDKKGTIDRMLLGREVFAKKILLKRLCRIIHPIVIAKIRKKISYIKRKGITDFILIDAPLLIESGLHKDCDKVIVVSSSLSLQIERSHNLKGIGPEEARQRIRVQMQLSEKERFADYIIDNNGTIEKMKEDCKELAKRMSFFFGSHKRLPKSAFQTYKAYGLGVESKHSKIQDKKEPKRL